MIATLLTILALAGTPACGPELQEPALIQAATNQGLTVRPLTGSTLTAFNAELARQTGADVKDFPDMDQVDSVEVKTDEASIEILFVFKDGCRVAHATMLKTQFDNILGRMQADN